MDRFESMSTFVAVVEAGSLSAASRALGVPLATVSRKVSDLESHLGTRLLNRTARRVALTDAGHAYLHSCKEILEQLDAAEKAASGEYSAPRGDLTLSAPIVFGRLHVLPIVTEFLAAHADIDVRLLLTDRVTNLLEEHIDAAVRVAELPDSSLVAARVGAVGRVVCASPAYLKQRGTPRHPSDLRTHDCVTFEGLSSARQWVFGSGKQRKAIAVRSRLAVTTAEAAVDATVAGVGVTRVLSYQVVAAEKAGVLRRLLRDHEPEPAPVHVVHAGGSLVPVKLRAFLDFAVPRLRSRL